MSDRIRAFCICVVLLVLACEERGLAPRPGAPEYQHPNFIRIFGNARVNAAGGNLLLERTSISVDTLLGARQVRAVYNSASGWLWDFQARYADGIFVDASGAVHEVSALADDAPIPGTIWRKVDDRTLATRGGLAYHFGPDGALEHVRWATLPYPRIRYVSAGAGLAVEQCSAAGVCAAFYWLELNPDGNPLSITGLRTGRVAELGYDALGRLETIRRPFEVASGLPGERFEYAGDSRRIRAFTSSEGDRVEVRYRSAAPFRVRHVSMRGEGDPAQVFRYGQDGDRFRTTYTNPLGGVSELRFDGERRLRERCRVGLALCSRLAWQGRRPRSRSSEAGATTGFVYADDRLVEETTPAGNVIRVSYEPGGLNLTDPRRAAIRLVEDDLGVVEERTYDPEGRPVSIRTGDDVVFVSYSGARARSLAIPGRPAVGFPVRGVHGHWLEAEVAGVGADSRLYDPVGNPVVDSMRVGEGGYLTRGYDGDRRLASVEMAASTAAGSIAATATLSVVRRSDGQPLFVRRPGGNDHAFVYDALGRRTLQRERVDGAWHDVALRYDAAGNVSSRTLPNGMRQELDYDAYGRLTEIRSLRHGAVEGVRRFTYAADTGLLETDFDSKRNGTTTFYYDPVTKQESHRRHEAGELTLVLRDLRSRVVRRAYVSASLEVALDLAIDYDLSDRITRISDAQSGETLLAGVYAAGALAQQSYGNGLTRTFSRDDLGRIEAMQVVDAAGAVVAATALERSFEAGPPRRQQVRNSVTTPLATTTEEFWLPIGDSLTDPAAFVGKRVFHWSNGVESTDYAWDAHNNLVGPSYNGDGSRLLSASGVDYAYDAAGFAVERDGVALEWDANGLIARAGDYSFEWDMRGVPISISASGIPLKEFRLFGGALESTASAAVAFSWGPLHIDLASGEKRYSHYDFRGNVSFVSDDAGAVVEHHSYRPFGLDRSFGAAPAQGTFARAFGFGSLMLMGARVYDPRVGRFLSQDPVFQLTNPYTYAQGNPVHFSDSSGLFTVSADTVESAVAFGIATAVALTASPVSAIVAASATAALAGAVLLESVAGDAGYPSSAAMAAAGVAALADAIGATVDASQPPAPPPAPPEDGGAGSGEVGSGEAGSTGPWSFDWEFDPEVPAFGPACSPAQIMALPNGLSWLPWLVAFNAALGLAVLRRRREDR